MTALAGRIVLLWGWRRAFVAFVVGALTTLSQAPYDFFAVCLISFPVLVWLLDGAAGDASSGFLRRLFPAFATGWWFGFGYFIAGLWWTGAAMLVDIGNFAWALPIAVVVLPAGLALFYGLAAALARLTWSDGIGRIAALAAAFAIAEWLRGTVLSGFPWNAVGYGLMPIPLMMQSVSVVGMTGMNALAVFLFATPALLGSDRHVRFGLSLAILLAALHVGFGYWQLQTPPSPGAKTLRVRIVQPSIDQQEKWDHATRDRIFDTYLEMSRRPFRPDAEQSDDQPQLIIWPETAVPFLLSQRPDALTAIKDLLGDGQTLLAGAVRLEGEAVSAPSARYYNSVVAINDSGEIFDAVDKVHLVPFGEYVPLEGLLSRIGITRLVEFPGGFSAGVDRHAIAVAPGVAALPFICYEIIFPGMVRQDAATADILVNLTNDAWFGDTPGPFQHFRQAQLRAVETGRPLIRAANNGISAVVDARGRVKDALALGSVGDLDAEIPLVEAFSPPVGNAVLNGWIGVLIFAGVAIIFARKPRSYSVY